MLNIILFGAPGAGKGTQAARLNAHYGLVHLATGDILRQAIADGTPLGREAKAYMERGELAPNQMVVDIIAERIVSCKDCQGFIFDGFPRNVEQAECLDTMLNAHHMSIAGLFFLEVPEGELIKRLQNRASVEARRDDQDEEIIRHRLTVYQEQTAPVADYYKRQNKLFAVKGTGSLEEVQAQLIAAIDRVK